MLRSRYTWDESKTWENASEEVRSKEVTRLKEKGMTVDVVARRIGITVGEVKKYYGD